MFDADGLTRIDASGAEAMEQLVDSLERDGVTFVVARLKGHLREAFDGTHLTDRIGEEHFFPTVARAVEWCSARPAPPAAERPQ